MVLTAIGLTGFYCIACLCLGFLVIRFLTKEKNLMDKISSLTILASAFLMGQGVLSNVWLLLALPGWFSPWIVISVLVACLLGGGYFTWPYIRSGVIQLRSNVSRFRSEKIPWKLLGVLTIIVLLVQGMSALIFPPKGDAVAFYMALPKVIAASHRLRPLPEYEAFTQIGLQGEFHYAALMSLGSAQFAKILNWPTSLALAIMLLSIGTKVGLRDRGKLLALSLLLSSTAFTLLISDGKVDIFGAAMGMAAYYWAAQTAENQGKTAPRLCGLLTGFAVIAKISYIPVLIPGVFFLVFWRKYSLNRRNHLKKNIHSEVISAVVLGLWLIFPIIPNVMKNSFRYGEPFAPFFLFRGQSWIVKNSAWFTHEITRRIIYTYPLALVFGQYPMQYGNLSPLILAFAPLCFLIPRRFFSGKELLLPITVVSVLGVVIWLIYRPSVIAPRYILAPVLLFIVPVSRGAEYVFEDKLKARWLRVSIIVSACLLLLVTLQSTRFPETRNIIPYLTNKESECIVSGSDCRASAVVNREAALGDRVYISGYYRYWLRPDLLQCMNGISDKVIFQYNRPEELWASLYERGFKYLMIDKSTAEGKNFLTDLENVPEWLTLVQLHDDKAYKIFRLESNDLSHRVRITCRQIDPPAWDVVEQK